MSRGEASPPTIRWEETACLLCGAQRRATLLETSEALLPNTRPPVAVVRCEACGLCYTSPRPAPESMPWFYPEDYPAHQAPPTVQPSEARRRRARRFLFRSMDRDGPAWHGEGRLLDFGCGGGAFLQRMHARGWRVMGVDMAERLVRTIRDELGLPALAGDLSAPELGAASFDVITMRQSLEHVHRPLETLRQARRLLAGGGKLMVWVPNIESLSFRWFGPAWFGLDLPRHLVHFCPATLRRMVAEAGFQVERLWMVAHPSWIQRSAVLAQRRGQGGRKSRWLARRPTARLASWYALLTRQSDCIGLSAARRGD